LAHIQVLAEPTVLEATVAACFAETSTIGLRSRLTGARTLPRATEEVFVGGRMVRVKRVERPGGTTEKAESDDLAEAGDYSARRRARAEAERHDDE